MPGQLDCYMYYIAKWYIVVYYSVSAPNNLTVVKFVHMYNTIIQYGNTILIIKQVKNLK